MRKYHNIPTIVNNIEFASRKEATRYQELLLLQRAGNIGPIVLQPAYPIIINGKPVCTYYADFLYFDNEKQCDIVEDAKGVKTQVYRLKKKLVKACYTIDIVEV